MPLTTLAPWQDDLAKARTDFDARPWSGRLPNHDEGLQRASPWLPVQPQMEMPSQVWHPDVLNLAKPQSIDEHGYYTGGGNGLLNGLRLKSMPPPTYSQPKPFEDAARFLRGSGGMLEHPELNALLRLSPPDR